MFWFQFDDEWFIDATWVVGQYLASRHDEELGFVSEWAFAGPATLSQHLAWLRTDYA